MLDVDADLAPEQASVGHDVDELVAARPAGHRGAHQRFRGGVRRRVGEVVVVRSLWR